MSRLQTIFGKERDIIIGAIHLPPLPGFKGFPGFEKAVANALADVKALERGGADGIIFENNYDIPHTEFVGPATVAAMTYIGTHIVKSTKLPIGISVLWNDYRAAFSIARTLNLSFIRIPAFVDTVQTDYGRITAAATEAVAFRKKIKADNIAIFADIHVKHAKLLSKHTLVQSARLAQQSHADAIIVTGQWTGDAPKTDDLQTVRAAVKKMPILCGSGVTQENIEQLFCYANGAIVSTSLKTGSNNKRLTNLKPYDNRLDTQKVRTLVRAMNKMNK